MKKLLLLSLLALPLVGSAAPSLRADGPADNMADKVRPVPPPGVPVPASDRAILEKGQADLAAAIDRLKSNKAAQAWLPDIQIFHNAIRYALTYNEFFAPRDIESAKNLIGVGLQRAAQLERGETPWNTTSGPQAMGYVSEIDGSVQPYGLYIPESWQPRSPQRWRLDTWIHGRGETLSEVNFVSGALRGGGPFVRPDTFVIQPYGRYCCANKFAGEVDLLEAIQDVKRRFKIDEDRIVIRGFSMGGAAAWQFASHYASDWCAAAPGAGFSETPEFLKVFQKETLKPTWYEQKLWQWYDSPYYVPNYHQLPLVVYSGEIDSQKQAADLMEKALMTAGIKMTHIIGPKTGHSYHPQSTPIINQLVDGIAQAGRVRYPRRVRMTTPTLRYNRQSWVSLDGMGRHWEPATVDAEVVDDRRVKVKTQNVSGITLSFAAGHSPIESGAKPTVSLDGQDVTAPQPNSDRSWSASFHRANGRWILGRMEGELRKKPGLQGPIDDAFMGSFLMVSPSAQPAAPGIAPWVSSEMIHAVKEWRRQFRGEARVKQDKDVSAADISQHNLILWGDPGSNLVLRRIADQLPIKWEGGQLTVGGKSYPAGTHAPVMVFPNPLNPSRYVVLNSGFTYREYDYLNNARQNAKLPDWAIVDTTTPANSRYPGKVVNGGFFGEKWEYVEPPRP